MGKIGFVLSCFLYLFTSARAQTLAWTPPTNGVPQGYVVFHQASPGALDIWSAGVATNYTLTSPPAAGVNFYSVAAFDASSGVLVMSAASNMTEITNTPGFIISTVMLTSTNLGGAWSPWTTNHMVIPATAGNHFFAPGRSTIINTNLITFPSPPVPDDSTD